MRPQLLDVHDYMRCYRCTSRFNIPTYVSPATTFFRCSYCQFSNRITQDHRVFPLYLLPPPPPPPPLTIQIQFPTPPDNSSDFVFEVLNTSVNRIAHETIQYEPRPTPASKFFIYSLKAVKLTVSRPILEHLNNTGSCAICSDEFKLFEKVNQLACRHWFHTDCIISWLNEKNNCPLCRHGFPGLLRDTTLHS